MNITSPQEPKEVKEWIKMLAQEASGQDEINWDSLNVWYGNKLPKYLWDEWKVELSPSGFNWQKFLKLMSFRTDQIILWSYNEIPWENLVKEIQELIYGPLGQRLSESKVR
ncbi:MAG: hypothetical protein Q8P92_04425 [Candidatus Daviesbacteria bacterium]|nr:hypothetical protein [Candidatus Daviesbacteria bacterium]